MIVSSKVFFALATLLFSAGVAWFLLFPVATVSQGKWGARRVFVSENALPKGYNPSALTPEGTTTGARIVLQSAGLFTNITSKYAESGGIVDVHALASWVSSSLVAVGADSVDIQAFTEPVSGTTGYNVIGIVHGTGRMANQEAFVVTTDVIQSQLLAAPDLPATLTFHPLAAMLRIASILSHARWLAKDAVFVVSVFSDDTWTARSGVDGRHPGLEAWARHALDGKDASTVLHQHGLVRGAICLDWDTGTLRNANVLIRAPVSGCSWKQVRLVLHFALIIWCCCC